MQHTYLDSWHHRQELEIAQEHIDTLDRSRVRDDSVVGIDNFKKLHVSTVFSAIAIEMAVNDFIQTHGLFAGDGVYLRRFFAEAVNQLLWLNFPRKLKLVAKYSSCEIDKDLLKDVEKLIDIRNKKIHQKGTFDEDGLYFGPRNDQETEEARDRMRHMLRHPQIARDFLGSFGPPGNAELSQWQEKEREGG